MHSGCVQTKVSWKLKQKLFCKWTPQEHLFKHSGCWCTDVFYSEGAWQVADTKEAGGGGGGQGGAQCPASELTSNGDAVITAQLLQFLLLSFSFLSQLLFLLPLPLLVLSFPLKPGSLLLLLLPSLLVEDRLLKGRWLGQASSILATRRERDCSVISQSKWKKRKKKQLSLHA